MTKDHVVVLRITDAERAALLARADQHRITLPELMRLASLAVLRPPPAIWHGHN